MKLLKIVLFFCMCFGFLKINAQNQSTKDNSGVKNSSTETTTEKTNWPAAEKPYVTPQINENDQYMGRAEQFLHVMVVDKLPSDFPKYEKAMGLRYYNNLVDNYFLQHVDLLKDKWKQKVLRSSNNH